MRIGDPERRRTERRLRAGYLRGELSADTFEQRLAGAFGARRADELEALAADLPSLADRLRALLRRHRLVRTGTAFTPPQATPGDALVLGRASACDVRLDEPSVSRCHAELRRLSGGWLLVDRWSTNGTWVNGVRIERAHVRDGDEIRLGGARLLFRDAA